MSSPSRTAIKQFCRSNAHHCYDPATGDINATQLAENCAHRFDHDEWLDDPEHPVWEEAQDAAEWPE